MSKIVNCRDVGFDCDGVVRAETEDEALRLVAQHARDKHGVTEITPELVDKVREVMREE